MNSGTERLLTRVRASLEAHWPGWREQPVLVACSGGGDSVALAAALDALGLQVRLAHLDHGVREGSSDDARWVASLAASRGWPCLVHREVVPPGASWEARARALRLAFLAEAARAQGVSVVALGHHREDQAETVLFRLARGGGLTGLAGMPPTRELAAGVRLVRPLLDVGREDLREALTEWGLGWREDPTNASLGPARNRLRHRVLPALQEVHPGAVQAIGHAARVLREVEMEARMRARGWLAWESRILGPGLAELGREAWLALPPGERAEALRQLARDMARDVPGREGLAAAEGLARAGRAGEWAGGWRLDHVGALLVLRNAPSTPPPQPLVARGRQPTEAWGWVVEATGGAGGGGVVLPPWTWRSANPAQDQFRPPGSPRSRPLGHWLRRRGVPSHVQGTLLVLARGVDVAWVVGVGGTALQPVAEGLETVQMQATACFQV
ncbi:MAG: tRNA lysidine(34) synthetase TilS [Candidatus Sericytochromatia bacterium]|nr:tRNA lysidine(34) synthetase TilS [Candidatus Sericytochromatia bacterium]